MHCRTDGRKAFRSRNILDQFSGLCIETTVERKRNGISLIEALNELFIWRDVQTNYRSCNTQWSWRKRFGIGWHCLRQSRLH